MERELEVWLLKQRQGCAVAHSNSPAWAFDSLGVEQQIELL